MEYVNKIENMAAEWYKKAPHLPKNGQKWLATNAWWIVLVGVILGGLGVLMTILGTFAIGALLTVAGGAAGAALAGVALIAVLVALVFAIAVLVLMLLAISPLKAMQRKGWKLLFLVVLLQVASLALHFIFSFDLFGLIWGLLMAAVGAYFLYEVRDYFADQKQKSVHATTSDKKADTKEQ